MTASHHARNRLTRLCHELLTALRFGIVGLAATGLHLMVVTLLLLTTSLSVLLANTLAFLTAFSCSFIGNYVWTFAKPGQPKRALARFFIIAFGAYAINMLLLNWLSQQHWITDIHAALSAAMIVPVITFLGSRLWGFQPSAISGDHQL
jgi:putative flippase GtrA